MKPVAVRATDIQKAEYQAAQPVYPLWGFVTVGEFRFPVESLSDWSPNDPKYEVIAPKGQVFAPDYLHTVLCYTLDDLRDRMSYLTLQDCDCESCAKEKAA